MSTGKGIKVRELRNKFPENPPFPTLSPSPPLTDLKVSCPGEGIKNEAIAKNY